MFKLTTYTEKDGKKSFAEFEGKTKASVMQMAERNYRSRRWEVYTIKQVVRLCATNSEVADIYKNKVL